ncbi:MAG: lipoyl(octanoyl) transferase LipB [Thermoplasmataceae archaeon]
MINLSTSNLTVDLGIVDFNLALEIQHNLRNLRERELVGDVILFLQHPPIYTVGRRPDNNNFSGINVIATERGGDVTYHGPGQLVVYPIMKIGDKDHVDARKFVNSIQNLVISSIEAMGYDCHLGHEPGIWVSDSPLGDRKVASIGMAIVKGVSFHGISINIGKEVLEGFSKIRPCGMDPFVMGYIGVGRIEMINAIRGNLGMIMDNPEHVSKEKFYEIYEKLLAK